MEEDVLRHCTEPAALPIQKKEWIQHLMADCKKYRTTELEQSVPFYEGLIPKYLFLSRRF